MRNTFPDWIEPMAATLTQERFTGPEWSFEQKFDGIRLLAYKNGKQIDLFSRNNLPQNLPVISQAIAKLKHNQLILDGEITWGRSQLTYHVFDIMWLDGDETMSLPLEERRRLLRDMKLKAPLVQVAELNVSVPGAVPPLPLGEDRGEGRSIATGSSDNVEVPPWEVARENGWEGVIAKRRGSVYEQRRSRNWLKMKCELAQEFVVGGFTDPQGKRVGLGALLVGYYEYGTGSDAVSVPGAVPPLPLGEDRGEGRSIATGSSAELSSPSGRGRVRVRSTTTKVQDTQTQEREPRSSVTSEDGSRSVQPDFVFAGKIGTGFNTELLLDLRTQLDQLEIPKPPFTKSVGLPRLRAHWVQPKIVVQVGFIQWTKYNKLRHPRLLGIRNDKDPRDVVRE